MQVVSGKEVSGAELANLVVRMVEALNSREIPTAGSILEHFNRELVTRVRDAYAATLDAVVLPVAVEKLDIAATLAHTNAINRCPVLPCCRGCVMPGSVTEPRGPAGVAIIAPRVGSPWIPGKQEMDCSS